MHIALAALFAFAILTLWVPGYWPVTVFQAGIFVLAGITLWRSRRALPRFSYPLFPLSAAVIWGLFQLASGKTVYAFDTQSAIVRWASFLAVFVVGLTLFRDRDVARWFRSAMLWFAFAVSILATVQTFTTDKIFWLFSTPYQAVMGPILNHSHFALFIEVALPFALYECVRRERGRLLHAGMAAVMYAAVIASASRAGTALATAEVVIIPALLWARGLTQGRTVGAAFLRMAALFAVFTAVVGWEHVQDRFLMPDPMMGRREFAESTLKMVSAHPWYGVGLGAWPTAYPRYATMDDGLFANQAHDDWLQWTAEGGIPLGIILFSLFGWSILPAARSVWGLGVIAFFLHAAVDFPFSRPALGSWAILVVAMLAAREAGRKKEGGAGGGVSSNLRFPPLNLAVPSESQYAAPGGDATLRL
jgi:O-antigen ligase